MSENWAVCVGIDRYDNLTPLTCARHDAEAVSLFFRETAGFKRVYFLADDAARLATDFGQPLQSRPTFGNLLRFLRVRFEQAFLQPSDNLWFFFAGHGRRERDQDYLLPLDADPGNVEETGIPVRYIVERLRRSGAENVILLLDACRNEGARDGQGLGLQRQKGTVTISSCSPTEHSYEIGDLGHGAFTYGLLEALRLHGERNCATVERLDSYLQARVPEICRLHGKPPQTPCTFAEPLSKRHFILLPGVALPDDLDPLKIEALQAETTGDFSLAEQLWWRVNAVQPTDAQSKEAIKRIALKLVQASGRLAKMEESVSDERGVKASTRFYSGVGKRLASRRNLILYAGASVTALIAGGVMAWSRLTSHLTPQARSETVSVVTVDGEGRPGRPTMQQIECFTLLINETDIFDFSVVPKGEFLMGSPIGEPFHHSNEGPMFVKVREVAIGRTAVTQRQWLAVVTAHPSNIRWALPIDPSSFKGDDLPVETVSWQHAWEYCARLSALTGFRCRLPTEAEWEYACRARTTTPFHFGPTLTPELANYCGTGGGVCGTSFGTSVANVKYADTTFGEGSYGDGPIGTFEGRTKAVGTYPQNRFGLFEMHGNVWEHCQDNFSERLEDIPDDGSVFAGDRPDFHVIRGGSWSHHPAICRSAYRDQLHESSRGWEGRVGFRVACDI